MESDDHVFWSNHSLPNARRTLFSTRASSSLQIYRRIMRCHFNHVTHKTLRFYVKELTFTKPCHWIYYSRYSLSLKSFGTRSSIEALCDDWKFYYNNILIRVLQKSTSVKNYVSIELIIIVKSRKPLHTQETFYVQDLKISFWERNQLVIITRIFKKQ